MAKKSGQRETTERQPRERKSRKQVNHPGSSGDSESSGGAYGCEMGVAGRTVKGRNGGTLTPHPPGSNGGVHRGPGRFPGLNVVRGLFMRALGADGLNLEDLRRVRKHRKRHALIPFAWRRATTRSPRRAPEIGRCSRCRFGSGGEPDRRAYRPGTASHHTFPRRSSRVDETAAPGSGAWVAGVWGDRLGGALAPG